MELEEDNFAHHYRNHGKNTDEPGEEEQKNKISGILLRLNVKLCSLQTPIITIIVMTEVL